METKASVLVALGAIVPLAHFVYSVVRDGIKAYRGRVHVRLRVTTRKMPGDFGYAEAACRCVIVSNVGVRPVSVVEVRHSRKSGVNVIDIGGGRHDIAPGCSETFQINPYFSEVFVELGTGDVFSVAL